MELQTNESKKLSCCWLMVGKQKAAWTIQIARNKNQDGEGARRSAVSFCSLLGEIRDQNPVKLGTTR